MVESKDLMALGVGELAELEETLEKMIYELAEAEAKKYIDLAKAVKEWRAARAQNA